MANEKIGILIEAKDNASSTIKNVKSNLGDLGKETGGIGDITSAFGSLSKAAGVVGVAIGAIQAGGAVVELAQLGAQAQRVETSFATLTQQAGISTDGLLSDLQKASSGSIANTELMLTANRALTLGVADSSSELSQLMEVAIARGKALGLSAQQAFSDLVTGIGRMSPLILDNLGIITGGEKVFEDYADSIGKSASALSDTERKQALVNKVIAESRDLVRANQAAGNDAAASFERVGASFQNLKTDLGELFGPAIAAFASTLATAVDATAQAVSGASVTLDLNEAIGNVQTFQDSLARQNDELIRAKEFLSQTEQGSSAYNDQLKVISQSELQLVSTKRMLEQAQNAYFDLLRATYPSQQQNADAMNRTSAEAQAMAVAIANSSGSMVNQQTAAANLNASINLLAGSYDLLLQRSSILQGVTGSLGSIASQVAGAAGGSEGVNFFNETTAAAEAQIKAWQEVGYSQEEITSVLLPSYTAQVRKSAEETYVFGQAATKANQLAQQSVKALSAEYENIKSTANGILSGALNDIGGVNLDTILPREDAVNEDARRLADVAVKGFDSPWAAYFKEKFPEIFDQLASSGDPKTAAAQILREFQSGLRPELLDKGRAKELVKRAIIGEQNIKTLSDEIAAEVAKEMGVSLEQAQTAAAKALGGTTTEQKQQKISVVPTIDKTQLSGQELNLTAKVTTVNYADSIIKHLDYSATVTTLTLDEKLALPILAAQMSISQIVIPESVKPPTPVVVGGLTIDAVALRSDVVLPEVVLAGSVAVTLPDTSEITSKVLSISAIVGTITLGDNVSFPILAAQMVVDNIVIAEGISAPTPTLTTALLIDRVTLLDNVALPDISIAANATIALANLADIQAQQVDIAANVILPETFELSANVTLQPLNTTAITETPLQLSALVATIVLADTAEIPQLHSTLTLDSVIITNETAIPAPPVVGSMTISTVSLSENVVLPVVNLSASTAIAPLDVTNIEQTPINLTANVALPDLSAPLQLQVALPDLRDVESAQPTLTATIVVDWLSASIDTPPDEIVQRLALHLPVSIDWELTDTETPKAALLERMSLPIVPSITFDGVDTITPLEFIQQQLTPVVIPSVDYLSIGFEQLEAAGQYIASGIGSGIAIFNLGNAIVAELDKAQVALQENGIASGRVWGSSFNAGAGEHVANIVNVVVSLALSQIARASTRTGAQ